MRTSSQSSSALGVVRSLAAKLRSLVARPRHDSTGEAGHGLGNEDPSMTRLSLDDWKGDGRDPVSRVRSYDDADELARELALYACERWHDDVTDGWMYKTLVEYLSALLGLLLDYFPESDRTAAGLATLIEFGRLGHLDKVVCEMMTGYEADATLGLTLSKRVRNTDWSVPRETVTLEHGLMPRRGFLSDEDYTIGHYVTYRGMCCVLDITPAEIVGEDPVEACMWPLERELRALRGE